MTSSDWVNKCPAKKDHPCKNYESLLCHMEALK